MRRNLQELLRDIDNLQSRVLSAKEENKKTRRKLEETKRRLNTYSQKNKERLYKNEINRFENKLNRLKNEQKEEGEQLEQNKNNLDSLVEKNNQLLQNVETLEQKKKKIDQDYLSLKSMSESNIEVLDKEEATVQALEALGPEYFGKYIQKELKKSKQQDEIVTKALLDYFPGGKSEDFKIEGIPDNFELNIEEELKKLRIIDAELLEEAKTLQLNYQPVEVPEVIFKNQEEPRKQLQLEFYQESHVPILIESVGNRGETPQLEFYKQPEVLVPAELIKIQEPTITYTKIKDILNESLEKEISQTPIKVEKIKTVVPEFLKPKQKKEKVYSGKNDFGLPDEEAPLPKRYDFKIEPIAPELTPDMEVPLAEFYPLVKVEELASIPTRIINIPAKKSEPLQLNYQPQKIQNINLKEVAIKKQVLQIPDYSTIAVTEALIDSEPLEKSEAVLQTLEAKEKEKPQFYPLVEVEKPKLKEFVYDTTELQLQREPLQLKYVPQILDAKYKVIEVKRGAAPPQIETHFVQRLRSGELNLEEMVREVKPIEVTKPILQIPYYEEEKSIKIPSAIREEIEEIERQYLAPVKGKPMRSRKGKYVLAALGVIIAAAIATPLFDNIKETELEKSIPTASIEKYVPSARKLEEEKDYSSTWSYTLNKMEKFCANTTNSLRSSANSLCEAVLEGSRRLNKDYRINQEKRELEEKIAFMKPIQPKPVPEQNIEEQTKKEKNTIYIVGFKNPNNWEWKDKKITHDGYLINLNDQDYVIHWAKKIDSRGRVIGKEQEELLEPLDYIVDRRKFKMRGVTKLIVSEIQYKLFQEEVGRIFEGKQLAGGVTKEIEGKGWCHGYIRRLVSGKHNPRFKGNTIKDIPVASAPRAFDMWNNGWKKNAEVVLYGATTTEEQIAQVLGIVKENQQYVLLAKKTTSDTQ